MLEGCTSASGSVHLASGVGGNAEKCEKSTPLCSALHTSGGIHHVLGLQVSRWGLQPQTSNQTLVHGCHLH